MLYINACKKIKSQANNDKLFIVELDVLESKVEDRAPGSSMSWIVNLKHQPALGNIKGFLAAALGIPEDKIDAKVADAAVSAENPFHGRLIKCEAIEIKTQKTKQDFTKCKWSEIAADQQERSEELHQAAGFAPF